MIILKGISVKKVILGLFNHLFRGKNPLFFEHYKSIATWSKYFIQGYKLKVISSLEIPLKVESALYHTKVFLFHFTMLFCPQTPDRSDKNKFVFYKKRKKGVVLIKEFIK